jgi:predicted nucleic acid-binding protein
MPDLPFIYWNACVFLSYINGITDRVANIDPMLRKSGTEFQIITSAMTIIEVAFGKVEQDQQILDEEMEKKINALWEPPSPIQLVEYYPLLGHEAKALMRQSITRGWSMKPMDAIHLATARRLAATKFHTYDDRLFKYSDLVGFPIELPQASEPELPYSRPRRLVEPI